MHVQPEARRKGVGYQIVAKLVEDFKEQQQRKDGSPSRLVLLTLSKTVKFYEPHEFQTIEQVSKAELPSLLVIEYMAGIVVAAISAKSSLVCMELV